MTPEQITHMKNTVTKAFANKGNDIWKEAFSEYNAAHPERLWPISMSCFACYWKVLTWCIEMNNWFANIGIEGGFIKQIKDDGKDS